MKYLNHPKATYIQHMGDQYTPAKISYICTKGSIFDKFEKGEISQDELDSKVIAHTRRMAKDGHSSPFEHCTITLLIDCTLWMAQQITRHRAFSYQMQSRRYVSEEPQFYNPLQNPDTPKALQKECKENLEFVNQVAKNFYNKVINQMKECKDLTRDQKNVYRELARSVLPSNTHTRLYITGNLHNFAKFLALRHTTHAQYGFEALCKQIEHILIDKFGFSARSLFDARIKNEQ